MVVVGLDRAKVAASLDRLAPLGAAADLAAERALAASIESTGTAEAIANVLAS
jgi:hypothetical protein